MRRAWQKYGAAAFSISVLRTCEPSSMDAVEQWWIGVVAPLSCINIAKDVQSPNRGRSPSAETRAKMAAASTGRVHSPETRAKISAANKGQVVSVAQRAILSKTHKGKTISVEQRAANSARCSGAVNPFYGRTHTEAVKAAISASNTGRRATPEMRAKMVLANAGKRPPPHVSAASAAVRRIPVIGTHVETGIETHFDCIRRTSDAGFMPTTVGQCCRGKMRVHKGHTWRYAAAATSLPTASANADSAV